MNILEYTKKFHEMEMQERLFELKSSDGIYFWDIVRHDISNLIFRDYLNKEDEQKKYKNDNNKSEFRLAKLFNIVSNIFMERKYLSSNLKQKYIFFTCSRNIIDGKETDIISQDYLKIIGKDSLIIETFGGSVLFNNYTIQYNKKVNKLFKKTTENYYVDEIIKNAFGVEINVNSFIKNRVEDFKVERDYYMRLLINHKPKVVFFVQNGIQKGLMHSCRELRIPSIELQHGIINYCHPAYSYPKGIESYKKSEIVVPDILFGFSDYWIKDINYPVKKFIAMGNTYYGIPKYSKNNKQNEITFITADIFQNKIESYIDFFLEKDSHTNVNIKLHPNQLKDIIEISKKYRGYMNVKVYYNEVELKELFERSYEVVVVTSTSAYEAIQFGCRVKIIRDNSSYDIENLFDHPNVIVLDKPSDIFKGCNNKNVSTSFFDLFNENKMKSCIEHIEKRGISEWE